MKKPSLRTRALAPAVVLAVGALVATPALAQVSTDSAVSPAAATATPTTDEAPAVSTSAPAAETAAPAAEAPSDEAPEAPETTSSEEASAEEAGHESASPAAAARPAVTFPDHSGNAATRTIGEDFTTTVAHTGVAPGATVTVVINGNRQTHGGGTFEAPATVTEADGQFQLTVKASYLDTVASGTNAAVDTVQVRVGAARSSIRVTEEEAPEEEAPAKPTVTFPEYPDNTATRTIGKDFKTTVAYTGATPGDTITVVINGNTQTHGGGTFEAPATVTEADGEFEITLPARFLDEVHSGTADDQDVLQVRVGSTRNHVRITEEAEEVSPMVRMDYPLPAQTVHDTGIEVRVKTAPHAPVDITKASVQFTGGYTLELPDEWDGTADENGDYVFTIAPDTPITSSFRPERNTTVGQLSDGDGITVQTKTAGKSTSFTTRVEGTAEEAKPTVTFPEYPDNTATRTIGKNFKTKVAYTGATPGDTITVIINGYTQKHGEGTYVARETVTDTDGEFYVTANASYLDEVHSGTDKASDVIQVRVGNTRNHVRVTEVAAPSVTFPEYPDNTATRTIGKNFTARVAYTGATAGDPVTVVVNGNTQKHGEGTFEAPATVTETDGQFQLTVRASYLDEVNSGTADDQDVLQVRVGSTRNHVRITEEAEEVSPMVRMDYPLPAQTVHDTGIEVRVKTAPQAPVDVTRASVQFTGGYTLELPDEWDGTADENGDYVFTIAPDTPITSSFRPERNTTVGQLSDGDGITVQVNTAGKSTSFTTRVEGTAEEAKPTVTFPNNPEGTAERKAGESISLKVRYDDVNTGDPISVVANGEVLTHGEGYESIQKTDYVRGGFFVRLDGEFLDGTRADGEPERDTIEVRVGEGSATIDILEISADPTDEPTDDTTDDPTGEPTDNPTEDPSDEPTDDSTDEPTDDATDDSTDDATEDPSDDATDDSDQEDDEQGDELALTIEPDRIGASDFVDPERGVVLSVTGLEPGDDIDFAVTPTSDQNVDPANLSAVATEDGVASTIVYGTTSVDPAAYIGDYSVEVSGIDEAGAQAGSETAAADTAAGSADALTGTFTVTSDDDAKGGSDDDSKDDEAKSGDSDDDSDGGRLPRTGGELSGLAAGAALLAVGGAAVAITRRRMNQG